MSQIPISVKEVEPCKTRLTINCATCGAKRPIFPHEVSIRRFCSPICAGQVKEKITGSCELCGKTWKTSPSRAGRRFCSVKCARVAEGLARRRSEDDRFWERVNKNGPIIRPDLGPCWIWTGPVDRKGYGRFSLDQTGSESQQNINSNKFALERQIGRKLLPDHCALHKCDNPPCVRNDGESSHLFEGTRADNAADMAAKGRSTRIRFSDADRLEIIRLRTMEGMPWLRLSRMFGVHRSAIQRIVREATAA